MTKITFVAPSFIGSHLILIRPLGILVESFVLLHLIKEPDKWVYCNCPHHSLARALLCDELLLYVYLHTLCFLNTRAMFLPPNVQKQSHGSGLPLKLWTTHAWWWCTCVCDTGVTLVFLDLNFHNIYFVRVIFFHQNNRETNIHIKSFSWRIHHLWDISWCDSCMLADFCHQSTVVMEAIMSPRVSCLEALRVFCN